MTNLDNIPKFHHTRRVVRGGTQDVFRFSNGYGASVVRHAGSYGYSEGKYEIAVITHDVNNTDPWDFELCYDTPITSDVIGYLSDAEVASTLMQIAALPNRTGAIDGECEREQTEVVPARTV